MDVFSTLKAELGRRCLALDVREGEPMRGHTSFRIGGPAALMALPRSSSEARAAAAAAMRLGLEPVYMGNGSNLLVSDSGTRSFVIKTFDGLSQVRPEGESGLWAESGVLLSKLAALALEKGLAGLEFAHGIPGTLGGAVTMNAGAYGGEMAQVVRQTDYLDSEGKERTMPAKDHSFSYRHSAFSSGGRLILGCSLALRPGDRDEIKAKMAELSARRREKQPLEYPSAGSTFKRPPRHFAAALIDGCGLKGLTVGGAQVSEKHAGFIVNRGGASCDDVLRLIDMVRERVLRETGVELELEVRLLR